MAAETDESTDGCQKVFADDAWQDQCSSDRGREARDDQWR